MGSANGLGARVGQWSCSERGRWRTSRLWAMTGPGDLSIDRRRGRYLSRFARTTAAVVACLCLLLGCGRQQPVLPDYYELDSGHPDQLILTLLIGPDDPAPKARVRAESDNEVVVAVSTRQPWLRPIEPHAGVRSSATVTLTKPLGQRVVKDQSDQLIPLKPTQR